MDTHDLARHRAERDTFFREHYATPISDDDLVGFTGLTYFEPDSDIVFKGRYVATDEAMVDIVSSAGTSSSYHKLGVLHVEIAGSAHEFVVLDDGDGNPFIAFRDETNGDTTYDGGRYVSVDVADDGSATIDFNLASNPYCVYDEEFVCPLPPLDNRLSVPIEAGEKMYRK